MQARVLAVLGFSLLAAACGNTMEEKAGSGALGGAAAGAVVGGPVGAVVGGAAGAAGGAVTEKIEDNRDATGRSDSTTTTRTTRSGSAVGTAAQ